MHNEYVKMWIPTEETWLKPKLHTVHIKDVCTDEKNSDFTVCYASWQQILIHVLATQTKIKKRVSVRDLWWSSAVDFNPHSTFLPLAFKVDKPFKLNEAIVTAFNNVVIMTTRHVLSSPAATNGCTYQLHCCCLYCGTGSHTEIFILCGPPISDTMNSNVLARMITNDANSN